MRSTGVLVTIGLAVLGLSAASTLAATPRATRFTSRNREQSYTVPPGVTMLGVEAVGGFGYPNPTTSNNGMDLTVALPVTPGTVLFVEVGAGATGTAATFGGGGAGGAGDAAGGAGGGASDVRTCSMKVARCPGGGTSSASRLVVAGGGGGLGGGEKISHAFGDTCGGDRGGGNAYGGGSPNPVKVARGTVIPGQPGLSTGPPEAAPPPVRERAASGPRAREAVATWAPRARVGAAPGRTAAAAARPLRLPSPAAGAEAEAATSAEAAARAARPTSRARSVRRADARARTAPAAAPARASTCPRPPATSSSRPPPASRRR